MVDESAEGPLDYKIVREYLHPDTHKKVRDEIGVNLGSAIRNFEEEIRASKRVKDTKKFAKGLKEAATKALKEHLPFDQKKDGNKLDAMAQSIVDGALRDYFGVDEQSVKKMLEEGAIENYDTFHHQMIERSQTTAADKLYAEADNIIGQYLTSDEHRQTLFKKSGKDLGDKFDWTDTAKKTEMDARKVREILKLGLGGELAPKHAKDIYNKTITYSGPQPKEKGKAK